MSNIKRYIGLSMSFCVADVLSHKIDTTQISCIVTSTRFHTAEEALEHYFEYYWNGFGYNKEDVLFVLRQLWQLLYQPRLAFEAEEHRGHMLSHGHWLDTFDGRVYKNIPSDDEIKRLIDGQESIDMQ